MRSRTRRFSRRFRRGKREHIWVRAEGVINPPSNGDIIEAPIVQGLDWTRATGALNSVQKGCVVVRSIVQFDVSYPPDDSPPGATRQNHGFVLLRRVDQDDTAVLNSGVDLFNEDWMRMESYSIQATFAVVATLTWADVSHGMQRGGWDSKLKRKLTSEDEIRIGASSTFAIGALGSCDVHFFAQTLLELP